MSNKLISVVLMLVFMWPLTAADLPAYKKEAHKSNRPTKDLRNIEGVGTGLYVMGSDNDYDVVHTEDNAMVAQSFYGRSRGTADTLQYVPADGAWNGQFIQSPGDGMMVVYKMPADGIIKGINVPVYEWGTGDQQLMVSLHTMSYPMTSDGAQYPLSAVDGDGWIGGYDMDANGHMTISGTTYTPGGTAAVCDDGSGAGPAGNTVAGSQDPLGDVEGTGPAGVPTQGLLWPDGFSAAVMTPDANPAGASNWFATVDLGTEPVVTAGTWVGILFAFTGAGDGTADEPTGFYYDAADGVVDPWIFAKFYNGCGGTSGNGGWHIRHWMVNAQLAVELTGDRGPVLTSVSALPTTLSTADRDIAVSVTDDNPSGEAAGVSTVTVSYQLDSLTANVESISLALTDGTSEDGTWTGSFPGQSPGTTVYYSISAYDNNANATTTATASYFIFTANAGNDLIFNNQDKLYGSLAYSAQLYFYWAALSATGFDIWDASYGGLTDELTGQYDVIVEMAGTGPTYINDDEVTSWWASGDKVYLVFGDEWLGARSGWADGSTAGGSVAREVLGIDAEYNDIAPGSGVSRLMALEGDVYSGALWTFMQNANADSSLDTLGTVMPVQLNYDPGYETGGSNWLDGVDALSSHTVNMTGLGGILDSTGAPAADASEYDVMISGQAGNGGRSAFLAFDPIALNTQSAMPHDAGYVWVGAHQYSGASVSPLVLAYEGLGAGVNTDNEIAMPNRFELKGNYPNPFNPSTSIAYSIDLNSNVNVTVYSLLGEEIATLFAGDITPGTHEVRWNGVDNAGEAVASGVYIYRVEANNQALTGKMMLLK